MHDIVVVVKKNLSQHQRMLYYNSLDIRLHHQAYSHSSILLTEYTN
jgi:hypothetical protein